jgi:hypothetical protein
MVLRLFIGFNEQDFIKLSSINLNNIFGRRNVGKVFFPYNSTFLMLSSLQLGKQKNFDLFTGTCPCGVSIHYPAVNVLFLKAVNRTLLVQYRTLAPHFLLAI